MNKHLKNRQWDGENILSFTYISTVYGGFSIFKTFRLPWPADVRYKTHGREPATISRGTAQAYPRFTDHQPFHVLTHRCVGHSHDTVFHRSFADDRQFRACRHAHARPSPAHPHGSISRQYIHRLDYGRRIQFQYQQLHLPLDISGVYNDLLPQMERVGQFYLRPMLHPAEPWPALPHGRRHDADRARRHSPLLGCFR